MAIGRDVLVLDQLPGQTHYPDGHQILPTVELVPDQMNYQYPDQDLVLVLPTVELVPDQMNDQYPDEDLDLWMVLVFQKDSGHCDRYRSGHEDNALELAFDLVLLFR